MASVVETVGESATQPALEPRGEGAVERPSLTVVHDVCRGDYLAELDRRLVSLCRERGPLRAVLARIAARLVCRCAWERLGYARLSDYAVERLGLSARWVRDLAQVGLKLNALPLLEDALVSGTLGWTKVRLLARLPPGEDEVAWIDHARRVTAEELSKEVRAVDRGSVEAGAAEDPEAVSRLFEVRCSPEVRSKWYAARGAASRAVGGRLNISQAAEVVAAEVLSALPIDDHGDEEPFEEAGVSWSRESETAGPTTASEVSERPPPRQGSGADSARPAFPLSRPTRRVYSAVLQPLLHGLEHADAFALDERFRCAVSREQRLETRMGPLLVRVWGRRVHRALGYKTRAAYARERLGMDPTRARALVRLERTAVQSEPFARGYRSGELSWVTARELAPIVSVDLLGRFVDDWVAWAGRVTVRRLREDVERALALSETDREAFRDGGGLPPEAQARENREIGAPLRESEEATLAQSRDEREADVLKTGAREAVAGESREIGARLRESEEATLAKSRDEREVGALKTGAGEAVAGGNREIGAPWRLQEEARPLTSAPEETCWARFIGPADVVKLFKAVLCTVRRRMEQEEGRLPTPGEALGVMLDHAFSCWGAMDGKLAVRHKVFARDGWRCTAPGCTSMQNLHDHHIRFRSAGGDDALENRTTLCAWHHLRGVHAGLLRCVGRAPDGLRWEMGIRPGGTPLMSYRSGDLQGSTRSEELS